MSPGLSPHLVAVFQALFVTFLWSTSWVLIKVGLADIPALPFAGLRYMLAFCILLPLLARPPQRAALKLLTRRDWFRLVALGVTYYALTQGAQFAGLALLPAVTASLILNYTPVVVALLGILFIGERPTLAQWGGVALLLVGAAVYFHPAALTSAESTGLIIMAVGLLANASALVLGRYINRERAAQPLVVTTVSMGIGAALLLATGIVTQGIPALSLTNWAILGWLAAVNTAFAFTLWNHTLRTLSAVESSVINNTMLVQIAILAWLFLGETLLERQILGLLLASGGAFVVQRCRRLR